MRRSGVRVTLAAPSLPDALSAPALSKAETPVRLTLFPILAAAAVLPAVALAQQVKPAAPKPAAPAAPAAKLSANPTDADVRCVMAMIAMAAANKDRQVQGQVGAYYYLGRLRLRAPNLDLAAAIKGQAPGMGGENLQAELTRCAADVQGTAQSLQTALNALRPPAPPPAAAAPAPVAPK